MAQKFIGNPAETNERMKRMVRSITIDDSTLKQRRDDFREQIVAQCDPDWHLLDCGKSMRDQSDVLAAKVRRHEMLDINDFDYRPDIVCDLCDPIEDEELKGRYDAIVCLAVLEHCYDPLTVCRNLHYMLKPGGTLFGYVPWMFRYHAPDSLVFQDYWRFSKDALAYAFRDWQGLTLYPLRGRASASLNLLIPFWKRRIEQTGINPVIDRIFSREHNVRQCSGYNFVAVK